jgi:hypothetical protein
MKKNLIIALVLIGLVITGAYAYQTFTDVYSDKLEAARAVVVENDSLLRVLSVQDSIVSALAAKEDSLQEKVYILGATSSTLRQQVNRLKAAADTGTVGQRLAARDVIIVTQDSIITVQDSVITTQGEQITVLRSQVRTQDRMIVDLRSMNDRLSKSIRDIPNPKNEKFLGILPMPSRTVVAIASAATTVLVIRELDRR